MAKLYPFILSLVLLLFACRKEDAAPLPQHTIGCEEGLQATDPLLLLAHQIVYDEVNATPAHPAKNEVLLPAKQCDTVYIALKAIKALKNPNADTVFRLCSVQNYYTDSLLRTFTLHIRRTPCSDNLIYYYINNKCSPVDSMLALYNIHPWKVKRELYPDSSGTQYIISMAACKPLNTPALVQKLKKTGLPDDVFVYYSFALKPYSITIEKTATHTTYEFGYGWQCTTGCTKWRYWKFRVDAGGKATFVQSYGDGSPPV